MHLFSDINLVLEQFQQRAVDGSNTHRVLVGNTREILSRLFCFILKKKKKPLELKDIV